MAKVTSPLLTATSSALSAARGDGGISKLKPGAAQRIGHTKLAGRTVENVTVLLLN
ncbi:MAG: hypothetical protein R3A10_18790 [Caldilineaceae bacterium]